MYLDESIKVGEVPEDIQEMMEELDRYYKTGDDFRFAFRSDDLEANVKQACLEGLISERQLDKIFRRYGWR